MEKYKYRFTPEEVIGWIVIALMIATAIWMLLGSPTEIGVIIAIFGFTATSKNSSRLPTCQKSQISEHCQS